MLFEAGDRVQVTSTKLEDGGLEGATGRVVRTDGPVWEYAVVMDDPEQNSIGGFNWLGEEEIKAQESKPEDDTALLIQTLADALRRSEQMERIAEEERDRADKYRDAYVSLKGDDEDAEEAENYVSQLKQSLTTMTLELLKTACEFDELQSKYDAVREQNEELSAALAQEKAKGAQRVS